MIKDIQTYLKVKKLSSIIYRVCNNFILFPYSIDLDKILKPYDLEYQNKDIVVKNHNLPNYYTAYSILPDKRTKPKRVTDLTSIYKVGECIITLEKGNLVLCSRKYNVTIDVDSPKTRTIAYIAALLYDYEVIHTRLTDIVSE